MRPNGTTHGRLLKVETRVRIQLGVLENPVRAVVRVFPSSTGWNPADPVVGGGGARTVRPRVVPGERGELRRYPAAAPEGWRLGSRLGAGALPDRSGPYEANTTRTGHRRPESLGIRVLPAVSQFETRHSIEFGKPPVQASPFPRHAESASIESAVPHQGRFIPPADP